MKEMWRKVTLVAFSQCTCPRLFLRRLTQFKVIDNTVECIAIVVEIFKI